MTKHQKEIIAVKIMQLGTEETKDTQFSLHTNFTFLNTRKQKLENLTYSLLILVEFLSDLI